MGRAYALLRSQCVYCHRFRLPRRLIDETACKLRLLQHGLFRDCQNIDGLSQNDIGVDLRAFLHADIPNAVCNEAEGDGCVNTDSAIRAYTRRVLREHGKTGAATDVRDGKHEGASERRRQLIKEFLQAMVADRKCRSCEAISPAYRKDRSSKIFERSLSSKDKAANAQAGRKRVDALVIARKSKNSSLAAMEDEGIADVSSSSDKDEGDGESLGETGDVILTDTRASGTKSAGNKTKSTEAQATQRFLNAMEVRERLRLLFNRESEIIPLLFNAKPPSKKTKPPSADMFFLEVLLVPPNRYRPEARMGDSQVTEAEQNNLYKQILRSSSVVAEISREISGGAVVTEGSRRPRDMKALYEAWTALQDRVNALIDTNKNPVQGAAGKRNEDGIKQKLEKKEGLFRQSLMGKRVNFTARQTRT